MGILAMGRRHSDVVHKGETGGGRSLQAMGPRADVGQKGESGGGSEKSVDGAADKVKGSIGAGDICLRGLCEGVGHLGSWRWPETIPYGTMGGRYGQSERAWMRPWAMSLGLN